MDRTCLRVSTNEQAVFDCKRIFSPRAPNKEQICIVCTFHHMESSNTNASSSFEFVCQFAGNPSRLLAHSLARQNSTYYATNLITTFYLFQYKSSTIPTSVLIVVSSFLPITIFIAGAFIG